MELARELTVALAQIGRLSDYSKARVHEWVFNVSTEDERRQLAGEILTIREGPKDAGHDDPNFLKEMLVKGGPCPDAEFGTFKESSTVIRKFGKFIRENNEDSMEIVGGNTVD